MDISIINPCNKNYHACSDFKQLTRCEKVKVAIATFFAAIFTSWCLGLGGVAAFRTLVGRFKHISISNSTIKTTELPKGFWKMTADDRVQWTRRTFLPTDSDPAPVPRFNYERNNPQRVYLSYKLKMPYFQFKLDDPKKAKTNVETVLAKIDSEISQPENKRSSQQLEKLIDELRNKTVSDDDVNTCLARDRLLKKAATLGELELVKFLVEFGAKNFYVDGINFEVLDEKGTTLLCAAEAGKAEVVAFLLAHGADPSENYGEKGPFRTGMHWFEDRISFVDVIKAGNLECVKLLCTYMPTTINLADICTARITELPNYVTLSAPTRITESPTYVNLTAVNKTIKYDCRDILEYFYTISRSVRNTIENETEQLINIAIEKKSWNVTALIIEKTRNLHLTMKLAVADGELRPLFKDLIIKLLKEGVDPSARDQNDKTAFQIFAEQNPNWKNKPELKKFILDLKQLYSSEIDTSTTIRINVLNDLVASYLTGD